MSPRHNNERPDWSLNHKHCLAFILSAEKSTKNEKGIGDEEVEEEEEEK